MCSQGLVRRRASGRSPRTMSWMTPISLSPTASACSASSLFLGSRCCDAADDDLVKG